MRMSVKWPFILAGLSPALYLVYALFTQQLGANPIEELLEETGLWALILIMVTLAITPLRGLTGWKFVTPLRKTAGLLAFFYTFLHFGVYLGLDRLFEWREISEDLTERAFIIAGFLAFIVMVPLALTSTKKAMKKWGKKWKKLHLLTYVAAVLAVIHYWWMVKKDITDPLIFAIILALLFGYRVFKKIKTARI